MIHAANRYGQVAKKQNSMNEIERIRDLDDEVFTVFQEYFPQSVDSEFKKTYPTTYILITMFDTSATFIKNSIYDSCESDDYYGAKILYRSLIEHFLRFKYLFINWGKTKSDDFAIEYKEIVEAKEILETIRAKVSEYQLYNSNFQFKDWDSFLEKHPKFKNITRKEVEQESKKVTFKNIIRFLNMTLNQGKGNLSGFLGKLILEYSELSSYVHGGMNSHYEMMKCKDDKIRVKEYERICGLSFQISTSIKLFSLLMIVQTDKEFFTPFYYKLDSILKKINN